MPIQFLQRVRHVGSFSGRTEAEKVLGKSLDIWAQAMRDLALIAIVISVLLAVFAPAFPLSLWRQEIRPQTAQAHSLGRYGSV